MLTQPVVPACSAQALCPTGSALTDVSHPRHPTLNSRIPFSTALICSCPAGPPSAASLLCSPSNTHLLHVAASLSTQGSISPSARSPPPPFQRPNITPTGRCFQGDAPPTPLCDPLGLCVLGVALHMLEGTLRATEGHGLLFTHWLGGVTSQPVNSLFYPPLPTKLIPTPGPLLGKPLSIITGRCSAAPGVWPRCQYPPRTHPGICDLELP